MEKNLGKIKTLVVILVAIILTLVSFLGLYAKQNGIWTNKLPDYKFGMEMSGYRELRFVLDDSESEKEIYVDENGNYKGDVKSDSSASNVGLTMVDEEGNKVENPEELLGTEENTNETGYTTLKANVKVNPDEAKTIQNFEKAKKIIQKRLDSVDLNEYNIRQDMVTGELIVELPDNDNVTLEESLITTIGRITVEDYQNGVILIDDSHVKNATMLAANTEDGYQVYIQLVFDDEGKALLKDISNKYRTVVNDAGEESTEYVSIKLDDQILRSTYFGDTLEDGKIQVPYGQAYTDYAEYVEFAKQSAHLANLIKGDSLPLKYSLSSDNYIRTAATDNMSNIIKIVFLAVILIVSVIMIIKYKASSIKYVAMGFIYVSLLTIICRYTNVAITLNSLVTFLAVIALNYCFYFKLLKKLQTEESIKVALAGSLKEFYISIIPVIIIAIIFTFISNVAISSIGMLLFWGLIMQVLVSLIALV